MPRSALQALLFVSLAFPVQAAESAATALEKTTVTATPFADGAPSPLAVDVIGGEDKRRRQNASLGDLLDELPGVSSMATGTQVGKPVIRGLSGNRIRVLSEGLAQDHQQYGVRHQPNVDPFLAERVEVVRGPMSMLYGSDALGGVVNLVPRSIPSAPAGESLLRGRVTGAYRSNNAEGMGGLEAEGAQGGFGWTLAASKRKGGDLTTADSPSFAESGEQGAPRFTGRLEHTDFRLQDAALGLGYSGDFGRLSLRLSHWDNQQNYLLPDGNVTGQKLENANVALGGEFWTGADWLIKPTLGWQQNLRQAATGVSYVELDRDNRDLDVMLDRYSLRLAAEHPRLGDWKGELGMELLYKDQDLRRGHLVPDARQRSQALYAFEAAEFGRLGLQLGARYDRIRQQARADEHFEPVATRAREWSVMTGSIAASWRLSPQWQLQGTLGRGFRAPSIFELHADGVHGGVAAFQRGNPELVEETSFNTELGLRWQGDALGLSATVFRNRIDDYIFLANTGEIHAGSGLPVFESRQGDARLQGVELALEAALTSWMDLQAGYEAVDGELTRTGDDLPLLPANRLRAELSLHREAWRGLRAPRAHLGVDHAWDKAAAGPYEPFAQFDAKPFGTASTAAYTLWEIGVGFDWPLAGRPVAEVDLRIQNLFDTAYRDFLDTYKGYALGAGRNVMLTVSVPFGDN